MKRQVEKHSHKEFLVLNRSKEKKNLQNGDDTGHFFRKNCLTKLTKRI